MRNSWFILTIVLLVGLLWCGGDGTATAGPAPQEQVTRGETVYTSECAECHEPGGVGPELTAAGLAAYQNAQALFDYTHQAMPLDAPGSLTDEQYWDVIAYLLAENGQLPADTLLGPDNAASISLTP